MEWSQLHFVPVKAWPLQAFKCSEPRFVSVRLAFVLSAYRAHVDTLVPAPKPVSIGVVAAACSRPYTRRRVSVALGETFRKVSENLVLK